MAKKTTGQAKTIYRTDKHSWLSSLGAKLSAYHLLFLIVLIISTVAALFYIEQNVLLVQGHEQSKELGHRVVAELGQRISATETLTKNLAQMANVLVKDSEHFMNGIPKILDLNGDSKIAGGGIWPEPYAFDSLIERRSFFWGREASGSLKYYDDYNDMGGPGYHNEEWYVPARYLEKNQVYWSKSYMDPYSYEPMVTCTAPIYDGDHFFGVATVDLKLAGLDEFFKEKLSGVNGYIFAVDRNNKLLSYPDKSSAKHFHKDENDNRTEEFMTIYELQGKYSSYSKLSTLLDQVNSKVYNLDDSKTGEIRELSKKLAFQSYQIEIKEAENIAAFLKGRIPKDEQKIQLHDDPILGKQTLIYVFVMPETGWKILVVSPVEKVNAFARQITFKILKVIILLELIVLLFMFFVMNRVVTGPLANMSEKLHNVSDLATEEILLKEEERSDEIGHLAHEVNRRSEVIKETIRKLKESNAVLEDRVKERTEEIESALNQVEEARKRAEAANKSKSHFLANMSHEIRTPMNAILGYTDLLFKEIDDPRLKGFVVTIKNSGQSLLTLINDILDLSKVEAGKIDLQLRSIKIERLFKGIVDQFKDIAARKDISLELEMDESIPELLEVDDHRIGQILNNLVGNAVKFIKQGRIKICLSDYSEKCFEFFVEDEGPGIPKNKLEQIFEDFEQIDNVDIDKGTGLGLAITKRLVELMDGTIRVESEIGKGSKFIVTLCNVEKGKLSETNEIFEEVEYTFREATVLIADDINNNIELLKEYLSPYPFEIITANNGVEALSLTEEHRPDLILMDMKMPEMDGFTASKMIKENPGTSKVPIIAITAAAMKTTEEEVRELCDGYLKKPISETQLIAEISRFLKAEKTVKNSSETTELNCNHASQVLGLLSDELVSQILAASEKRELTDLLGIIKKLKMIQDAHPSSILEEWLKSINEHMDNFDMDNVQKELEQVNHIIEKLKKAEAVSIS